MSLTTRISAGCEDDGCFSAVAVFLPTQRYASAVLAMTLCLSVRLSVCLSVTSQYCVETAERIELVFGADAALGLSYTVLKGEFGYLQNNCTFLWNCQEGFCPRGILSCHVEKRDSDPGGLYPRGIKSALLLRRITAIELKLVLKIITEKCS